MEEGGHGGPHRGWYTLGEWTGCGLEVVESYEAYRAEAEDRLQSRNRRCEAMEGQGTGGAGRCGYGQAAHMLQGGDPAVLPWGLPGLGSVALPWHHGEPRHLQAG